MPQVYVVFRHSPRRTSHTQPEFRARLCLAFRRRCRRRCRRHREFAPRPAHILFIVFYLFINLLSVFACFN